MEEIQTPQARIDAETGLLDLLVTLAENLKLLVVGPLLVGLCALGLGFFLPQTFQSVAVVQAEQSTASLVGTAAVLDPVIRSLSLAKGETVEEARLKLRENIKTTVGRNDKLLTLTVSASAPEQAQAIARAVLQQTYQESRPKGGARTRLETQLREAQARLQNAQDASTGVLKRLESSGSDAANSGAELARGYAELLNASGAAQTQIVTLETQLEGLSESQLVQSPTLPRKASQPRKGLIAIGATLVTGLLLLLFVFMRQALRNTEEDAQAAGKLVRIRRALGLK